MKSIWNLFSCRGWLTGLSVLVSVLLSTGCRGVDYQPVSGVGEEINELGKAIAQAQRNEVWTGGNEYSGCYTEVHARQFHESGKVTQTVEEFRQSAFFQTGVAALKAQSPEKQAEILSAWSRPIDRTWAQNGQVGNGTTEAGQRVEAEIAKELTEAVREALR